MTDKEGGGELPWDALRAIARSKARCHVPADAVEDVVQEVLLALVPRASHLRRDVKNLAAYVRTLALNGCRAWHRRRSNVQQLVSLDQLVPACGGKQTSPGYIADRRSRPNRIPRLLLVDLLRLLRGRERRVLVRHFLGGQSITSVARKLGLRRLQVRRSIDQVLRRATFLSKDRTPPLTLCRRRSNPALARVDDSNISSSHERSGSVIKLSRLAVLMGAVALILVVAAQPMPMAAEFIDSCAETNPGEDCTRTNTGYCGISNAWCMQHAISGCTLGPGGCYLPNYQDIDGDGCGCCWV